MRSGKSRRRPAKPSSSDSRRDVLYDQLLSSLTGDEGLASGQEYFRWCQGQALAGRRDFAPLDLEVPWPIQRYQALTLLQALSWDDYLRIAQTIREAKEIDLLEQDPLAGVAAPTASAVGDPGSPYEVKKQ